MKQEATENRRRKDVQSLVLLFLLLHLLSSLSVVRAVAIDENSQSA